MRVSLIVAGAVAPALHGDAATTPEAAALARLVAEHGGELQATHPGTRDPSLIRHFLVEVADLDTARRLIDRLLRAKAVEAAYLKPPDALP